MSSGGWDHVLVEFVSAARRDGLQISPSEMLDAIRAAAITGLTYRNDFAAALRATTTKRRADRSRFQSAFDTFFFMPERRHQGLLARLLGQGFSADEIAELKRLLEALLGTAAARSLATLSSSDPLLSSLFRAAARDVSLSQMQSEMQMGFYASHMYRVLGCAGLSGRMGALRTQLRDALGERGLLLADAVEEELHQLEQKVRTYVRDTWHLRQEADANTSLRDKSFLLLSDEEQTAVLAEVKKLSNRIKGQLSVRRRHARRGVPDLRRTMRNAQRTGSVPFRLSYRKRRRERPNVVLLCDVSESVRRVTHFLLTLVYSVQEAFFSTRSFLFVNDVAETTVLFRERSLEKAAQEVHSGRVLSLTSNSNYGRALGRFAELHLGTLDSRSTLVILGDARTNYHPANVAALEKVRRRVRRILWLNPEPPSFWNFGDSVLNLYRPFCDSVHAVHNLTTLHQAVANLLRST